MDYKKFKLRNELKELIEIIRGLDKKVVYVFISVAILQTISWYYTSRNFFRLNLFDQYQFEPNVYLYEFLYWFIGDFFTFVVLSILIIKFLFKEKLKDYGLKFGDYKTGLKLSVIFIIIMLPIIWFASSEPSFVNTYPQLVSARNSWNIFFIFEAGLLIYLVAWEFIWRGFMMFGLEKKFGYYAILIQMIPFLILHNGKPAAETFGAILGGIALGILAYRTRSIYYCVLTHMSVMFSIDLITTLRYRAEDYGIGISSLINILHKLF